MSVNTEQVRHIAKLARIAMSDEELERLGPELNAIIGWVEQLGEVDTDGVEPLTAVIEQKLRLGGDGVTASAPASAALARSQRRTTRPLRRLGRSTHTRSRRPKMHWLQLPPRTRH